MPTFDELLTHAFARADATQTFWNLYAVAVTALLGFLASAKALVERPQIRVVLLAGFVAFAVANYMALDSIRAQREQLVLLAREALDAPPDALLAALRPASPLGLRVFHGVLDIAVCGAIWLVPATPRRKPTA
jgi:hypothetical protein